LIQGIQNKNLAVSTYLTRILCAELMALCAVEASDLATCEVLLCDGSNIISRLAALLVTLINVSA